MARSGPFSNTLSSAVLSLVLAFLVWIAATNTDLRKLTLPANGGGLPIELVNVGAGLMVTEGLDARARVELLVPQERADELRMSDLTVRADLAGLGPGVHQVEVVVQGQPFAPPFRLLARNPDRILVRLDEVMTRELPIEASLPDALLPANYQVLTPTLDPPTMTLSGPRAVVESIQSAVARVSLAGARSTIIQQVVPELIGAEGAVDGTMLVRQPEEITVTVPIEARPGYRELIVRATVEGEPAPGYWVSDVSVDPKLLTVVGPPPVVAELNSIVDTEPVDIAGQGEGEVSRNVAVQLPDGVTGLNDGFVQVRVRIEPQTSSRRVTLTPEVTGLQPGLVVAESAVVPPTIEVLLEGPVTELANLNLEEVVATLDLTGLAPGTHLVEPRITPPGAIRAESVIPEQVEVIIAEQPGSRTLLLPVEPIGLPPDLAAVATPRQISVTLDGPSLTLAALDPSGLQATVDASGLRPGSYPLTPTLTLGDRIAIASLEPSQVIVQVWAEDDLLVLSAPVQPLNVAADLAATVRPARVSLRVAGPGAATALSQSPSFAVEVDAAGLATGSYPLRPQVRLPAGFTLVAIEPETVELQIRAR